MIITVDGPVSAGKRTVAKIIAKELGLVYCDTGAIYRCLAYGILKAHININDSGQLTPFLKGFTYESKDDGEERHYFFQGQDISAEIYKPDVTAFVTTVAANRAIREAVARIQKEIAAAANENAVFSGRSGGVAIFPDALIKIFVVANPFVRAKRYYRKLTTKYPQEYADLTLEDVYEQITDRDELDMARDVSPMKVPPGAHLLDTSNLSVSGLQDWISRLLKDKISNNKRP